MNLHWWGLKKSGRISHLLKRVCGYEGTLSFQTELKSHMMLQLVVGTISDLEITPPTRIRKIALIETLFYLSYKQLK